MTMEFVKTTLGDDPIIVECYFPVTADIVFQAWTDPDSVMKWFGPVPNSLHSASIDLRPGGAWQFLKSKDDEKSTGFEGAYLEVEPGRRLVFTWSQFVLHATGQREASPLSQVEISFTVKGEGTQVRLVHSAVHSDQARRGFGGGWEVGIGNLVKLLAEGAPGCD